MAFSVPYHLIISICDFYHVQKSYDKWLQIYGYKTMMLSVFHAIL